MHNIDRTLQELEAPSGEYGYELEGGFELGQEFGQEYGQELGQEFEQEFGQEFSMESGQEFGQEFGQAFGHEASYETQAENQELEMAYQLLEVRDEQELNQFLGNLMSRAAGAARNLGAQFVASKPGQAVGKFLVNVGQKTLPSMGEKYGGQYGGQYGGKLGQAVGGQFGQWAGTKLGQAGGSVAGKWLGTQAGNALANKAQQVFNLELEGLSPENQELEIARSFVRFATDLTRRAQQAVRRNPQIGLGDLGRQVIAPAAQQHAPGLLPGGSHAQRLGGAGTWQRRGNTLVLFGA